MAPDRVLAVDIGTSGCRAAAFSEGRIFQEARSSYATSFSADGRAEQDADLVVNRALDCIKSCLDDVGAERRNFIKRIVLGSALHSLVLLDDSNRPLRPLSIWSDRRALDECRNFAEQHARENWGERTGCPSSPVYPIYRLAWYQKHEPTVLRQATWAASIKGLLLARLFGRRVEDLSVAGGFGCLNLRSRSWDADILAAVGIEPDFLGEPLPCEFQFDGVPTFFRDSPGLSSDAIWLVGSSDGPLAHLGSVGTRTDLMSLTLGTSGAARIIGNVGTSPPEPGRLWSYYLNSDFLVSGQATNNGGNVIEWLMNTSYPEVKDDDRLAVFEAALERRNFDESLFFAPWLFAEREPALADRSAGFSGLRPEHGRDDLLAAATEGILFNLRRLADRVGTSRAIRGIVLSGTVAQSPAVQSLLQAIFPWELHRGPSDNASLWGAALLSELRPVEPIPLKLEPAEGDYETKFRRWLAEYDLKDDPA